MTRYQILLSAGVVAAASAGCGGLKLQLVDHSVRKPSNVAVYFSVDTRNGQPVAGLTPQDFRIYEDRQPVSVLESKQTILNPEVAVVHYTLLLIDMSGSVVDSGEMPALIQAASTFGDRVGPYQKVAVYTFDGSPHVTQIVGFGGNVRGGVGSLAGRKPRDPSTNLNGAVIEGIQVLQQQIDHAPVPLRFGTLVVFTDGTDRAHRASADDVAQSVDNAGFDIYVIGAGQEVDSKQLSRIGRSGTFASQNKADIQKGFDEIATRIESASKRYYLLSYCSPSRAGEHEVRDRGGRAGDGGAAVVPVQRHRASVRTAIPTSGRRSTCATRARPPPSSAARAMPEAKRPPPASPSESKGGVVGTGWNPKR